ncbi:hypothetical protein N665_2539s0004 [Sinapis alba]|nr:hypothetical protein N665_2539s0004 [Sinapis alba]
MWEYNDQGFKKVFKTKELRNQKQILIILPTAYIDKNILLTHGLRKKIYLDGMWEYNDQGFKKTHSLKVFYYPRLTYKSLDKD